MHDSNFSLYCTEYSRFLWSCASGSSQELFLRMQPDVPCYQSWIVSIDYHFFFFSKLIPARAWRHYIGIFRHALWIVGDLRYRVRIRYPRSKKHNYGDPCHAMAYGPDNLWRESTWGVLWDARVGTYVYKRRDFFAALLRTSCETRVHRYYTDAFHPMWGSHAEDKTPVPSLISATCEGPFI
ncbi:hypothetical protein BGX38DRAFT_601405 [Terfezia claveryi]|nr:hypothetical protein BGX38DRAFT_601405 [Terfezia claveryi]